MDPITAFIIETIITIALSYAAATIAARTQDHDRQADRKFGVRGTTTLGDTQPASFIIGRYATPGHRLYPRMTWGNANGTPNEFLVDVIGVSMLPVRGLVRMFVDGEAVTLLTGEEDATLGFPVEEYRDDDDVDHLWIKFYDGTQTTADSYLLAKFGSDANYPWQSDMIGRGVSYFIATARVNRELFPGAPDYKAEIDGITLSDPRGDNAHDNPIVAIRNILRGISYGSQWLFGPQKITDYALPSANWEPEMDKCDALVTLADFSTEKRFRCGMEVTVDTEPHLAIGELLKAASARIAEIGGIYKVLVAEPNSPVFSFTDEDIIVSEGQSYEPFPGLENTNNGVTATYPEPEAAWEMKEAPPLYDTSLEADDDSRRLVMSTAFKAVPFPFQVQRLMKAMKEEARRFRRHSFTGRPEWWEYEPLDAVQWTSDRNGYEDKLFVLSGIEDRTDAFQVVACYEQDPDDYSWTSDDQKAYSYTPIKPPRPAAQTAYGFSVEKVTSTDSNGNPRRAGIRCRFQSGLADIGATAVVVRLQSSQVIVYGPVILPYNRKSDDPYHDLFANAILPGQTYEVQGTYMPITPNRRMIESSWLSVTTDDLRYGNEDIAASVLAQLKYHEDELDRVRRIHAVALAEAMAAKGEDVIVNAETARRSFAVLAKAEANAAAIVVEAVARVAADEAEALLRVALEADVSDNTAAIVLEALTRATETGANAALIAAVSTRTNNVSASGYLHMVSQSPSAGWNVRVALGMSLTADGTRYTGGFFGELKSDGTVRLALVGNQVVIMNQSGTINALFDGTGTYINTARIVNLTVDNLVSNAISNFGKASLSTDSVNTGRACQVDFTQGASGAIGVAVGIVQCGDLGGSWSGTVSVTPQVNTGAGWGNLVGGQTRSVSGSATYVTETFVIVFAEAFAVSGNISFALNFTSGGSVGNFWKKAGSYLAVGVFKR